jgi:hypothetical protein
MLHLQSGNNLSLIFSGKEIKFNKQPQYGSGRLFATDIIPRDEEAIYLNMNFDKFHSIIGHPTKFNRSSSLSL